MGSLGLKLGYFKNTTYSGLNVNSQTYDDQKNAHLPVLDVLKGFLASKKVRLPPMSLFNNFMLIILVPVSKFLKL